MYSGIIKPGLTYGVYPLKDTTDDHILDRFSENIKLKIISRLKPEKKQIRKFLKAVSQQYDKLSSLNNIEVERSLIRLHQVLNQHGLQEHLLADAFALIKYYSAKVLGMPHYDEQLIAGWVLVKGMLAEMATGEGKTLTAVLPAVTMALTGTPVHVITANQYLAERDANILIPLYKALGLSVGVIKEGMSAEQRRLSYTCNITYCCNTEVAFDFMRDRLGLDDVYSPIRLKLRDLFNEGATENKPVLQGLCYAIVDEADSVLIDDARTPLIIANEKSNQAEVKTYKTALSVAAKLKPQKDFVLETMRGPVNLTEQGQQRVEKLTLAIGGIWSGAKNRIYFLELALSALHIFTRDKYYIVSDNKIKIIDENTGRTMQDRSWESGLQQMIETKEGCPVTGQRETVARLSYQKFFSHYLNLSGMSGTVKECRNELQNNYGLRVIPVPTHNKLKRKNLGLMLFQNDAAKWRACIARVHKLHKLGRPILIGTRSVEASQLISSLLIKFQLAHMVLNAKQDQDEAEVIASAGKKGQITVATNMAGRGTDIKLDNETLGLGGLHVIIAELNDEARVDRQLFGRTGRQGEDGSFEFILSLQEPIIKEVKGNTLLYKWLMSFKADNKPLPAMLSRLLIRQVQKKNAHKNTKARQKLLRIEEQVKRMLAFTGKER